jgi:hypothetical protein
MQVIVEDVRRRLCKRLGLPAGTTLLQLIEALPPDSELRRVLREIHQALQQPTLSEGEALRLFQALERALPS